MLNVGSETAPGGVETDFVFCVCSGLCMNYFFSECIFLVVCLSNIHNAAFLVLFLAVDSMVMYSFTFCVFNYSSPEAAN